MISETSSPFSLSLLPIVPEAGFCPVGPSTLFVQVDCHVVTTNQQYFLLFNDEFCHIKGNFTVNFMRTRYEDCWPKPC